MYMLIVQQMQLFCFRHQESDFPEGTSLAAVEQVGFVACQVLLTCTCVRVTSAWSSSHAVGNRNRRLRTWTLLFGICPVNFICIKTAVAKNASGAEYFPF